MPGKLLTITTCLLDMDVRLLGISDWNMQTIVLSGGISPCEELAVPVMLSNCGWQACALLVMKVPTASTARLTTFLCLVFSSRLHKASFFLFVPVCTILRAHVSKSCHNYDATCEA